MPQTLLTVEEAEARAEKLETLATEATANLQKLEQELADAREKYAKAVKKQQKLLDARSKALDKVGDCEKDLKTSLEEFKARETIAGDWRRAGLNIDLEPDKKVGWPGIRGKLRLALQAAFRDAGLGVLARGPGALDLKVPIDLIVSDGMGTINAMAKETGAEEDKAREAKQKAADNKTEADIEFEAAENIHSTARREVSPLRDAVEELQTDVARNQETAKISTDQARGYRGVVKETRRREEERKAALDAKEAKEKADAEKDKPAEG